MSLFQSGFFVCLFVFRVLLKFFILRARKFYFLKYKSSIFPNIRKAFFWENIRSFLRVYVSWSIIKFSPDELFFFFELGLKSAWFHFRKYKKSFLLEKYKNFFNIRVRKFHSWNINNFLGEVFLRFEIGLKNAPDSPIYYY